MDGTRLFRRNHSKKHSKHKKNRYKYLLVSKKEKDTLQMIQDLMDKYRYDETVNIKKADTVAADRDRYGFGWLKGCSYTCKEHADDLELLLQTITGKME